MDEGLIDISETDYHADPCPTASLSASFTKKMLSECPYLAMLSHAKLNPKHTPVHKKEFDLGHATHGIVLEGTEEKIVVPEFTMKSKPDDPIKAWNTDDSKKWRDEQYKNRLIPLLAHQLPQVRNAASSVRSAIAKITDDRPPFSDGKPEQTIVWQEETAHGMIWCRSRIDWLWNDYRGMDDLKTTEISLATDPLSRHMDSMDYAIQDAFYCRGLRKLFGTDPVMRFIFVSMKNGLVRPMAIDSAGQAIAEQKVEYAIQKFAECKAKADWPAYPVHTVEAITPAYSMKAWEEFIQADI